MYLYLRAILYLLFVVAEI